MGGNSLDGRVVLVTGAAQGQGKAIAARFVAEGASVMLADILDEAGSDLRDELGDRARYVHLDVSDEEQWAHAVDATTDAFGKLDGLVNNAGIFRYAPLLETTTADWNAVISVCQTGVFLGMRAAAPALIEAGGGTIVNTSSTSGMWGMPEIVAYVGAKFAVRGMTKVAAIELGPFGIRVNTVCPGGVETPMGADNAASSWAMERSGFTFVPLRRRAAAEEIANVTLFLTSDESSFCTGAEFVVDGGMLAGPTGRR